MVKLILIASIVAVAGCGAAFDTSVPAMNDAPMTPDATVPLLQVDPQLEIAAPEHADEALALVVASFGIQSVDVHWYGGPRMRCVEDPNAIGWDSEPGHCVGGKECNGLVLLAYGEGRLIHESSLTHESAHRRNEELTGDNDVGHVSHWFAPGGEVERENAALAEAGY